MTPNEIPSITSLGPFILVQAALAIAIVGTSVVMWMRGAKTRGKNESDPLSFFFDSGYLRSVVDHIEGMYRLANEIKDDNEKTVSEFRSRHESEMELLRDIRDVLRELSFMLSRRR